MATTQIISATPAAATKYVNTDCNQVKDGVKAAAGVIHAVVIDNTLNAAKSFVKLWDLLSGAVTVGTTDPDMIVPVPAGVKRSFLFFEGLSFATGITIAAVTTGGTGGTTTPVSDVTVEIVYV